MIRKIRPFNSLLGRIARKSSPDSMGQIPQDFDSQIHLRLLRLRAEYEQQTRPILLQPTVPQPSSGERDVA